MKYLIAVDSSDNSRYAFSQAKKRFFTTKDHVYILTVTESPTAYPFEDLLNFSSESYTEMNRKIEQMYAELLKKFGRKLTRASIPHTCLLARGTIKDVICRQAQDLCVDVVIMGRRGLGTLERTFMGSTSQYCVHNLNCSVLVIPFIPEENLTTKTEEELASELKSKEREEISGNIKCFDPNCHNEECLQHGSKFQKIGQYEREKWQAPEERLSEPKQQNVPIKSKGKKSKKNKNNKGNVGKSVGKWEDVTKEKGKEVKEEFAQVDPAIIEKEKEKRKGKITGELLKEQKTKLKHEEGTIEVTEEETEKDYLPKEEIEKEKEKRKGKITGELLKQQKTKLKHEEGTVDVIEEDKDVKETFASKVASKDVPVKETTTKSKKKKNNKRKNNKGKVAEEQKGKWEEKSKVENLPECLPKEAFPHVESAEPITGELLEQQKTKLKHEEGSIDVIEEDKEGKEFSKSKEVSSKKNISKESGGKWVEKGKGKEETKVEAKEGAGKKEAVFQEVTSKKKKNRKRRNKNKGKSPEEKGKVEEKKFENLPECLPKEAFPHFVAAKPITGELLSQQKKKLKHEKGTIDVTGEEKKEFLKSKESGGKVKGKGKGKGKEEFSESKEEFKKESGVKETPKESLPTAQSKNKKRNRNNKNKGKANVKETNVKGSNVKDAKDLPECLPKEAFPHFVAAKPITGDLLSQQKKKLKHEKGTIDVTGEEKKEFLKSKESGGKVKGKGKGKGKEEFSEVKLKEETEIEYLPKEELEKEKEKRKGKITGELLKKQKTKLKHEEGTVDVTGEEKKEFLKSKESGEKVKGKEKGKEEFKEETSSPITGKWKGKDISGSKPTSVSGSESPKIISKFESPKRSKLEEKECNDPLCNNEECAKHGTQVKEEVKKGPKWQGKVHEKKECNDPLCNNPHCVKHGKASKEKGEFIGSKGKESSSPSSASKEVPYSGKSFAEVVSQSSVEEKSQSPKIIEKSEHKAAINIGEGKIEGKIGSKTDEEGAWKGSVEVGYKGKDEKGKEYEGKHYEASIQSK